MTVRILAGFLLCALGIACATTPTKQARSTKLPPPPTAPESTGPSTDDAHFADVRKAAAAQLECPEDQVIVQCTERDREQQCIAVRAAGCEKIYEFQFGTD